MQICNAKPLTSGKKQPITIIYAWTWNEARVLPIESTRFSRATRNGNQDDCYTTLLQLAFGKPAEKSAKFKVPQTILQIKLLWKACIGQRSYATKYNALA